MVSLSAWLALFNTGPHFHQIVVSIVSMLTSAYNFLKLYMNIALRNIDFLKRNCVILYVLKGPHFISV